MSDETRAKLLRDWRKAVARSTNWVESTSNSGVIVKKANDDLIASLNTKRDDQVTLSVSINKNLLRGAFSWASQRAHCPASRVMAASTESLSAQFHFMIPCLPFLKVIVLRDIFLIYLFVH